jgi:hypothetical protein
MKKIILILFLVIVLGACQKDEEEKKSDQLLKNTNMELDSFDDWFENYRCEDVVFSWTTEESHSPTHSLKIHRAQSGPGNNYFSQELKGDLPKGKNLVLSASLKGKNIVSEKFGATIMISLFDKKLDFIKSQKINYVTGTFDWTTYSVLINVSQNTEVIIVNLALMGESSGTIYFDDVTLTIR